MSSRFDLIAQQLLQKDLDQCSVEELRQFAEAHPYLAAAQFLIAKKMLQTGAPDFREKAQKTALYFHMPVAFETFLKADELELPKPQPAPESITAPIETEAEETVVETPAFTEQITEEPVVAIATVEEPALETIEENNVPEISLAHLPKMEDAPVETALSFEPYHTVDYFASVGIKLTQEELPKDKFGKQLMSFTAWLKTMKKLPAAEQATNMDLQAEEKVEHLAADSVSGSEVVTETMAEVWLRQGQRAKAAEVYHKLSLLHPSKKAYFAAKLDNLKQ